MHSGAGPKKAEIVDIDRALLEAMPAGIAVCGAPDGSLRRWNARLAEILGRHPQPGEVLFPFTAEVIRTGRAIRNREIEIDRPDRRRLTASLDVTPITGPDGAIAGAIQMLEDVTSRKRAEFLRAGEQEALRQIAEGAPLATVLDTLTRAIDECARGELLSSILMLDPDGKRLWPIAGPNLPEEYTRRISPIEIGPSAGSCGAAAWRGEPVIVADIASDPLWADYRALALRHGLRACWSTPIRSSQGALLGTFAIYSRTPSAPRDADREPLEFITRTAAIAIERKRAENDCTVFLERERAARERVARILESVGDGVAAVDKDFRLVYLNGAAERALGRSRAELVDKRIWDALPAAAAAGLEAEWRRAARERAPVRVETHDPATDAWFEANVYPADDGGLSVYFRDVSQRKRYEQQLQDSAETLRNQQRWLEALLNLLPVPMLLLEPQTGRVTFANRAANELAGGEFPAGDSGRNVNCIDEHGRPIPDDQMPSARLARGERIEAQQMNWDTPLGVRQVLVFGETLPAMHGRPAVAVMILQDLTELKRAEEALRQAQTLESLGVLAGGVAHDFNNLLVGIMGNASLVLDDLDPSHADRLLLENVLRASERAAELTQQMLAYSGHGRFVVQHVDVAEQIRGIGSLLRTSIPKSVQLRFDLPDGLPPVTADASQIQQVIINLATNAAEAVGEGNVGTVSISAGVQEVDADTIRQASGAGDAVPGTFVYVEVRDTGCGMDEALRSRIFDPFFSTKFTGRGLGLAAVLGIVRGHKGLITVTSAPGAGTNIRVLLPASCDAVWQRPLSTQAHEGATAALVLVVDDETVVQETARAALERGGFEVAVADSGSRALDICRASHDRVALVLLDMAMPLMSGEETLRELRKLQPGLKVIVSSGYSEAEAIRRFRGAGVAGFLQKPYSAARLLEKIRSVLG